jgi:hypothetical protein
LNIPKGEADFRVTGRETIAVRCLIGAVHHRDVIRHAGVHHHSGVVDHRRSRSTGRDYWRSNLGVEAQLASDLKRIARSAVALLSHQSIDLFLLEPCIVERQFEGPYRDFVGAHTRQFALLRLSKAHDARFVSHIFEHRLFTSAQALQRQSAVNNWVF